MTNNKSQTSKTPKNNTDHHMLGSFCYSSQMLGHTVTTV